ncbi:DUF6348 family protein [Dyella jiangningensis]|uniref:DUF6348 family protein n=1 Tax=Dyella jiangningensis TaxID=1379159 RepID=UPI002410891C|nr:DUF6348 family protein [Dyella jiangningensis]MDG2537917.1 DUF6348 family protein [Dyella jiangningensis]
MQDAALQQYLLRLFQRHGVELEPDEDWLMTDGDFPAVRAIWTEGAGGQPGRLDVDIVISEERHIEESFAGTGSGEAACRNALEAFERSVFHVLLAACWYVTDERRLQTYGWELGIRTWDVFVAPWLSSRDDVAVPQDILPTLREALQREALSAEPHWVRLFHRRADDGQISAEVLLDNAPWAAGDRALASLAWPEGSGYSVRGFIMLDIRDY